MRKHINADLFKLLLAFLLISISLNPAPADASATQQAVTGVANSGSLGLSL